MLPQTAPCLGVSAGLPRAAWLVCIPAGPEKAPTLAGTRARPPPGAAGPVLSVPLCLLLGLGERVFLEAEGVSRGQHLGTRVGGSTSGRRGRGHRSLQRATQQGCSMAVATREADRAGSVMGPVAPSSSGASWALWCCVCHCHSPRQEQLCCSHSFLFLKQDEPKVQGCQWPGAKSGGNPTCIPTAEGAKHPPPSQPTHLPAVRRARRCSAPWRSCPHGVPGLGR